MYRFTGSAIVLLVVVVCKQQKILHSPMPGDRAMRMSRHFIPPRVGRASGGTWRLGLSPYGYIWAVLDLNM